MSKEDQEKRRIENMSTGGHLGGTKFGQEPGVAGANHAKPEKKTSLRPEDEREKDRDQ